MAVVTLRRAPSGEPVEVAQFANEFRDLVGSFEEGRAGAALTVEGYRNTPFRMGFMRHNQDDALYYSHQLNHDFNAAALGPAPRFHVHSIPMVDPSSSPQVVVLTGILWWQTRGVEVPQLAGWTTYREEFEIETGDAFKLKILDLGPVVVPADAAASDMLFIQVERPASTDPADTYSTNKVEGTTPAANLAIVSADVHTPVSRFGTVDEFGR